MGYESSLPKASAFRTWLWDQWYKHKDELAETGITNIPYEPEHYFRYYKYWLKREFKHQRSKQ